MLLHKIPSHGLTCVTCLSTQVRQPEEEDDTVLEQLLSQSPAPAVGLVALLKEGLDVRGVDVEKRLAGLQVGLLQIQLLLLYVV